MVKLIFVWFLRIVAAVILLQTLYFKFTAHPQSVELFTTLDMEPWGRIGTGIAELIAAILILIPRTTLLGALLGLGLMLGAIFFHLTQLGINFGGDVILFAYAVIIFYLLPGPHYHVQKEYTSTFKIKILTSVFNKSTEALNSLANVLMQLPAGNSYAEPCAALSNATIGQHTRHIIELYQCLLAGYTAGEIYYDERERNAVYENDAAAAIAVIHEIKQTLQQPDKEVKVFCTSVDDTVSIESNYYREVLYNLEHCIHHQALIKVALLSIKDIEITAGFGVAPSTLQYRQQCAQ